MEPLKIVAIVGSLRKESYNRQLALLAKDAIGGRADFELLDYADVPMMNQDIEYPAPPSVARVRETVKTADGVWFFTPEYNHFFPGVLKNLLDWLSRPVSKTERQVLSGKAAAISGITPGMSGTGVAQDHLVTLISLLNMKIMNYPRLTIPNAAQQANEQGKLVLNASAPYLQKQADAYLRFLEKQRKFSQLS
ncbi:MAG TPA: NAD(P)H-dependent oxidoreductase [Eubacteriales bacterium]|nr:NAD(P)H-dependent oxidoreductase [Eubacteriales bacterium]